MLVFCYVNLSFALPEATEKEAVYKSRKLLIGVL